MSLVYAAQSTTTVAPNGISVRLNRGEVWAADDPLVLARPGLFTPVADPRRTVPVVEEATAVPGVRRSVKRA